MLGFKALTDQRASSLKKNNSEETLSIKALSFLIRISLLQEEADI
jgi:hypothetical protein